MGDSERASDDDDRDFDVAEYLADVESGAGCTEIWEHLSEGREDAADRADHGTPSREE